MDVRAVEPRAQTGLTTIRAYRRPDGRDRHSQPGAGARHQRPCGAGERADRRRSCAGVVLAATHSGRGQIEPDLGLHLDQLVGLGRNPNVAAVLVVGVDAQDHRGRGGPHCGRPANRSPRCPSPNTARTCSACSIRASAGRRRWCAQASRARREACRASALVVGVECGHSDAMSGIVGNPVVGAAVDLLDRSWRDRHGRRNGGVAGRRASAGAARPRPVDRRADRRGGAKPRTDRGRIRPQPHRQQSRRRKYPRRPQHHRGEIARRGQQDRHRGRSMACSPWRKRRRRPASI